MVGYALNMLGKTRNFSSENWKIKKDEIPWVSILIFNALLALIASMNWIISTSHDLKFARLSKPLKCQYIYSSLSN